MCSKQKNKIKSQRRTLMEVKNLPDKNFKIVVTKMFTEINRTMHEQSKNFHKEIENRRKCQTEITELKNKITEL